MNPLALAVLSALKNHKYDEHSVTKWRDYRAASAPMFPHLR